MSSTTGLARAQWVIRACRYAELTTAHGRTAGWLIANYATRARTSR